MKRILLLVVACLFISSSYAQLTGIKTIPGSYATIVAAVADLNTQGVGAGGVTFNVTAGHTESITAPITITATGIPGNTIVFQKNGAGANPLVTRTDAGTLATSTTGGAGDAIIRIEGTDYITFNGIDVTASDQGIEYGYLTHKPSGTDGCQFVTIQNCVVSMTKGTSNYVMDIYIGNGTTSTSSATGVTVTAASGINSNVTITGNTLNNAVTGVYLRGSSAAGFLDDIITVGQSGAGNIIQNYGGATTAYGVYAIYLDNLQIAHNTLTGSGSSTFYGIFTSTGTNSDVSIFGNTVSLVSTATTSALYGINNAMGGTGTDNTIAIYNNIVENCTQAASTSGTTYLVYNSASAQNVNIYGNIVRNNSKTGSGSNYLLYNSNTSATGIENIYNNSVYNNSNSGTGSTYCLYSAPATTTTKSIYGNAVYSNTGGSTIYGLYNSSTGVGDIYKNIIYDILCTSTSTNSAYGIYNSTGTTVNIYNNFVYDIKAPASTNTTAGACGIYLSGGTTVGLFYNTVLLDYTSTSASNTSAGLYMGSTTPTTVDMRNNIIVNKVNITTGTNAVAFRKGGTSLTNLSSNTNYNLYYAGTPSSTHLIYYDGTNSAQTLAEYQALVGTIETGSITEDPPFISGVSPYNLHISTTVPTQLESAGTPVTAPIAITTDYDGNLRNASTPDIGADEFAGMALDIGAPVISLTPFQNTSSTTARLLVTTITDQSGVPTSGIGLPVLYWRINSGAWIPVTASYVAGDQYTFTFGGGVVLNDIVQYYIVAQDIYPTPNIGAMPSGGASGFTANPPACSTPPTTPLQYSIVGSICGTINVGTGQTYTTLTAAIADLNIKEVTCPVTFLLTDASYSTSETFPIAVNEVVGVSPVNTVTIKPAPGLSPTITGSSSTSILKFLGSSYIIIDGSNTAGGTTRNLTISNTATTSSSAAIWISSDGTAASPSNLVIKNCNILAGSNTVTSTFGVHIGGATISTSGTSPNSDNITIQNNSISKAYFGIYARGVAISGEIDNLMILGNDIGSATASDYITGYGMNLQAVTGAEVSGNEVFNMIYDGSKYGIYLGTTISNSLFSRNSIHGFGQSNTTAYYCIAIYFSSTTSVTNNRIENNLMYDLSGAGSTSNFYGPIGIRIIGGSNFQVYHNTVSLTGAFGSSTSGVYSHCLFISTATTNLDLQNNIFYNSMTGTSPKTYTVYTVAGTTFTTIDYNDYYTTGSAFGYFGSEVLTFAAWQTATGQDVHSLNLDPIFVSSTDVHPTNPALNNLGIYLISIPFDFNGDAHTNPPDMGALNFGNDPIVVTTAASGITSAGATLNGTINAAGAVVNSFFDYGLTTAYGTSAAGTPSTVTGTTTTPVSLAISSLTYSTTYHYRARGVTTGGLIIYGPDMTFTTLPPPPTVTTDPATGVTTSGATLNGTVNANGSSTTVTFEYGLTISYGSVITALQSPVGGSTNTAVSAPVAGLQPNSLYHFRVVGVNAGGTSNGNDLTFTTAPAPPIVVTDPATNIGTTTATLNGTVTAMNSSTAVVFEWGLTPAFGNVNPGTPSPVTGNTATPVLANIGGLTSNTTYYFRCVGSNAGGFTYGATLSFLAGCPPVGASGPITGPVSMCANSAGHVYTVAPILNATGYAWTVPAGATITAGQNTTSITVTFGTTSGNVSVYGTSVCGDGAPADLPVTVNPLPVPTIAGPASACQGTTSNVYTTEAGMTNYTWSVSPGGTITAGSGTNSITVTWNTSGANSVSVGYTNANGCTSAAPTTYAVTVNTAPVPTITGPASMCVNSGYFDYTTQAGFTNYVWTISAGGTINYGQGTNTIQVSWIVAGAQWVAVNYTNTSGCSAAVPTQFNVTVDPLPGAAGTITGTASVCAGTTGVAYSVAPIANAITYVWTLPAGASIASGSGTNSITVDFAANASSGDITVAGNNLCGNGQVSPAFPVAVTALPGPAGVITGMASLCQGVSGVIYTVDPVANATGYVWTVPTGATIVAGNNTNSITVDFSLTATSGTITVYGTNSCGDGTVSPDFSVTVNPIPPAPVIILAGNILSSSVATGNQWYFNGGPIPGATGQTYEATQTGTYWDVVTLDGCSSDTSNNIYVVIIGIESNMPGTNFTIRPNPNDGQFTVHLDGLKQGTYTIEVVNNLGVKLWNSGSLEIAGSYDAILDIRPVPAGIYTVLLRNNNKLEVRRVLVRY